MGLMTISTLLTIFYILEERMEAVSMLILGRIIERVMIVMVAGMSIWLGTRLFLHALPSDQEGEIDVHNFKIRLTKVGPGIFFGAFGVCIVVYALTSKLEFSDADISQLNTLSSNIGIEKKTNPLSDVSKKGSGERSSSVNRKMEDGKDIQRVVLPFKASYLSGGSSENNIFAAINTISKLAKYYPFDDKPFHQIGEIDRKRLAIASGKLVKFQSDYTNREFGPEQVKLYFSLKKKTDGLLSRKDRELIQKLDYYFDEKVNASN